MKQHLTFIIFFVLLTFGCTNAEGTSVNAKKISVSGRKMILFQGDGMHRLHNVEITISGSDGFIVRLLTKTTDRGVFYMPWIIPATLEKGTYDVVATDRFHNATTTSFVI